MKRIIRKWLGIPDAPVFIGTDTAAQPAPKPTRPAQLKFDDTEQSDFGRQVAMLLALAPGQWTIHDSLRMFSHPELGGFEFDRDDRLQHIGEMPWRDGRSGGTQNRQHALTLGDHFAIVAELDALLRSPMPVGTDVQVNQRTQLFRGDKPLTANKGDIWIGDKTHDVAVHDGSNWVDHTPTTKSPQTASGLNAMQAMQAMQSLRSAPALSQANALASQANALASNNLLTADIYSRKVMESLFASGGFAPAPPIAKPTPGLPPGF